MIALVSQESTFGLREVYKFECEAVGDREWGTSMLHLKIILEFVGAP